MPTTRRHMCRRAGALVFFVLAVFTLLTAASPQPRGGSSTDLNHPTDNLQELLTQLQRVQEQTLSKVAPLPTLNNARLEDKAHVTTQPRPQPQPQPPQQAQPQQEQHSNDNEPCNVIPLPLPFIDERSAVSASTLAQLAADAGLVFEQGEDSTNTLNAANTNTYSTSSNVNSGNNNVGGDETIAHGRGPTHLLRSHGSSVDTVHRLPTYVVERDGSTRDVSDSSSSSRDVYNAPTTHDNNDDVDLHNEHRDDEGGYTPQVCTLRSEKKHCPAGYQCGGNGTDPFGFCYPCYPAQLCHKGTRNPSLDVGAVICPAGHYCPTPKAAHLCPPGYYCPLGSVSYLDKPCLYPGTYCGGKASTPTTLCPAGYYCPQPDKLIVCPQGQYCGGGVDSPSNCAFLSSCPEGSVSPSVSWAGFLVVFILALLLAVIVSVFMCSTERNAAYQAEKTRAKFRKFELMSALVGHSLHRHVDTYIFQGFDEIKPRIDIAFVDLSLKLPGGKQILNKVSGTFDSGHLSAIMGPSGCGKSSLINVLCGKAGYGSTSGEVMINGMPGTTADIRSWMGFVPQDDTVHPTLTVMENLYYNAMLRLPRGMPREQKENIIDDVIQILGLESVAHAVVGDVEKRGISGGQRKRVNIGLELVACPSVLFLDEPTSGLDASAATEVLSALRRLSRLGMNIITIIHQPRYSIYIMFDDVLLLGNGGRTVFLGPSTATLDYFEGIGFMLPENDNPADFFLDVIAGEVHRDGHADFHPSDLFDMWSERRELGYETPHVSRPSTPISRARAASLSIMREEENYRTESPRNMDGVSESLASFTAIAGSPERSELHVDDLIRILKDTGMHCTRQEAQELIEMMGGTHDTVSRATFRAFLRSFGETQQAKPSYMTDIIENASRLKESAQTRIATVSSTTNIAGMVSPSRRNVPPPIDEDDEGSEDAELANISMNSSRAEEMAQLIRQSVNGVGVGIPKPRAVPLFTTQFVYLAHRGVVQWIRSRDVFLFDWLLVAVGAVAVGLIYGSSYDMYKFETMTLISNLTFGLFMVISSTRLFGSERVNYWREASAGINSFAYFAGKNLSLVPAVVLRPLLFVSLYYTFVLPRVKFMYYYACMVAVAWACTGIGIAISCIFKPSTAMVAAVVFPMVTGGVLSGVDPSLASLKEMSINLLPLASISYGRWAVEAILDKQIAPLPAYQVEPYDKFLKNSGFETHVFQRNMNVLVVMGFVARVIAYASMRLLNRAKQR